LASSAETGGRNGRLLEILLLQSRLLLLQNKPRQALKLLEKSLRLGQLGNYIRIYMDEGNWLEELLRLEFEQKNFNEPAFLAYLCDVLKAFVQKTEETSTKVSV
jgi:hypothetical protein